MAKQNKYKNKHKQSNTSVGSTATMQREGGASKPADGECHVNMSPPDSVKAAVHVEPAAAPVLQSLPAQSTAVEACAEPVLLDNSSYATADSDEPVSAATTPPSVAPEGLTREELADFTVPPALSPTPAAAPVLIPAALKPVHTPTSISEPAEASIAAAPAPVKAAPAPAVAAKAAYSSASAAEAAAAVEHEPAVLVSWAGQCLDWLLRAYTYPVYLTAGATVGLLNGVRDQLPGHSKGHSN